MKIKKTVHTTHRRVSDDIVLLLLSFFLLVQSCSLTPALADMKLGRNVARTFLDYYRLNPMVEKVAIPMPRLR